MGEGKSDHSGKRQGSFHDIGKSSSEAKITHGKNKGKERKNKIKERWPFLEGLTVDELARYRRRRFQDRSKENFQINTESVIQDPASEYPLTFSTNVEQFPEKNNWSIKDKEPPDLHVKEMLKDAQLSHDTNFEEYETLEIPSVEKNSTLLVNDQKTMASETDASHFVTRHTLIRRPSLIRRGTSLKCEGDFYTDTETLSAYVPYEGQHRPQLARRPTSLKIEGDMDIMTENCEKFIEWFNVSRPELMRVPTHLRMEGELKTTTENQEKYIPFVGVRRPELLRRDTNLKLEGPNYFLPEYTDVFKNYYAKDRLQLKKPQVNLTTEGNIFQATDSIENCIDPHTKQAQQSIELIGDNNEEENNKKDKEMKILISKLEDLNDRPLEIPEYRDAYKYFSYERPSIIKPEDEIGRADGSKISSPCHSKFCTKIDQDPEYKSKYLDYSRDHPIYRKPPPILRPPMTSPSRSSWSFSTPIHQKYHTFEYKPISEVRSQYVPYGYISKVNSVKMPANLRLEGDIDLQPEYRDAYCKQHDYQICNERKVYDRDQRSLSASRKSKNFWLSKGEEQDSFQKRNMQTYKEKIIGKPPPGSRRDYQTRATIYPNLKQPDQTTIRTRSPSPTYRLHVYDVDNEPRGFGRRKSSLSYQPSGRSSSSEYITQDSIARLYSSNFDRHKQEYRADDQPFVILDSTESTSGKRAVRKRQVNRNIDITIPISRGKPSTSSKWMPPWYDNTNTI